MMKFAQEAAQHFPDEIIELHHDKKVDAPQERYNAELIIKPVPNELRAISGKWKIAGCRGGNLDEIRIHSVRFRVLLLTKK